ncbi:P-loop NTPase fold protein [Streptomyces sp. ME02-6991-2A]|uniref:KAP family P-loop NTPase fold protein n=1 Tax=Streptomyces sp. ME02-6991-2A TaxID=3028677 RepID=UPI0010081E0E|nr:P-loop NTPase fold protein [Streptomyces sp. ME02-6991-2A]MDX3374183.1 P-loop NTPase fold protein [Streptomyces sp. ME02-6991-2A]
MTQRSYFRDDPEPDRDRLERLNFANRTIDAFTEIRKQSKSSVAGLIAPWGAGKSTTLEMIAKGLQGGETSQWTVVDLNPWMYSDVESLQLGFFVALREALPKGKKWGRKRERVGNFFTAVSPMGKVNGLVGVDASSALESLGEKIAGDMSANALKKRAEEVLELLEDPILFVMDDLDRLTPDELLMVFKLVRLVGRLPNVYYLLAYDEKTLLDLIQQTSVASGDRVRARDYMEKIIQVRFDIPDLRPKQRTTLVDSAINELLTTYSIDLSEEDQETFANAYRSCLRHYLTTPRAVNRYFAQIDAFYGSLDQEVNFIDFSLVTFIRTFEPGVYKNITGPWRDELLGEAIEAYLTSRKESPSDREARWHAMLSESHVPLANTPGIYKLLSSLFPRLRSGNQDQRRAADRRIIGDRDYFDRYFNFGVPDDDISDTDFKRTIVRVDEEFDIESLEKVSVALATDTKRTCRKLERFLPGNPNAAAALLPVLAEIYASAEHDLFSVDGSSFLHVEGIAQLAITEIPIAQIPEVVSAVDSKSYGAIMLSSALSFLDHKKTPVESSFRLHAARALEQRVTSFLTQPLEEMSTHDFRHVYHWRVTAGKEAADPTLKQALVTGPWVALDFAARSISVMTSGKIGRLSEVQFDFLDEVIGLDYFYDSMGSLLDEEPSAPIKHYYEDTIENRRIVAISQLRHRRKQDRQGVGE